MLAPVDITGVRLETDRLILRPWKMDDLEDFFDYASIEGLGQMAGWLPHKTIADSRIILDMFIRGRRVFAIELKETGKVVGTIGYMSYNADNATVEVGYSLAREQWGKGLMTEALTAVITETFRALDMHRIEAMHFTDNPASGRVMEKCGMTHEGHLREKVCCKGTFRDVEMWGILRKDWEKHHKKMGPA